MERPPADRTAAPHRILFVLEYYWPQIGGVEVMFQRLARELARRGHTCVVLTTRLPGTPREEVHENVRIVRVGGADRPSRYAFTVRAFPAALEIAAEVDLVHTTTYNAAPAAWFAGKTRGRPTLLTVHEYLGAVWHALPDTPWPVAMGLRLFERGCVTLPFDAYVAVSRATRNALRQAGVSDRRLSTVYNGAGTRRLSVDPERARRLREELNPHGGPMIIYYGRPGITKGVEVLIAAFERLVPRTNAQLLLILGRHPIGRRERLAALAHGRLGDAVTVLDSVPREQLGSYLDLGECIVVPSLTEGFGFTTLEASSLGKAVVASDVGSIPEVIFGRHLLVPPGDPDALAAALERVLAGDVPATPPREFPVERMIDGYLACYERLLGVPGAEGAGRP